MLNKKILSLIQDVSGCNHMSPAEAVEWLDTHSEEIEHVMALNIFEHLGQATRAQNCIVGYMNSLSFHRNKHYGAPPLGYLAGSLYHKFRDKTRCAHRLLLYFL